ncbi:MAG: DUF3644 domain-containing protein [Bryobacteraceae bacterium]
MKREAKFLVARSIDAMVLAIELFNRPWDRGRTEAVLIHIDHSFELLLKAAIVHRGGSIREKRQTNTIGFDHCVKLGLNEGSVKFLSAPDATLLRTINGLRDAAQHYLVSVSEHYLYMELQSGVTLYRDLLKKVFNRDLAKELPDRVLPVSTTPPTDLATLFDTEMQEVKRLLAPGKRHRTEALARLRALAILDGAAQGKTSQPDPAELNKLSKEILKGTPWDSLFTGAAGLSLSVTGSGPSVQLRITKTEGIPVHLIKDGDGSTPIIAVKSIDQLGYYNLGLTELANKLKISPIMTVAIIWHLKLQDDPDYFKAFSIGKSVHKRYSQKALSRIREELATLDSKAVLKAYQAHNKGKKKGSKAQAAQVPSLAS